MHVSCFVWLPYGVMNDDDDDDRAKCVYVGSWTPIYSLVGVTTKRLPASTDGRVLRSLAVDVIDSRNHCVGWCIQQSDRP